MFINRPQPDEYGSFFANYIARVNGDVLVELENQLIAVPDFLNKIPPEKHNYAYSEGKWTVKELLGHLIDTERIMAYRLLRFSRKDPTDLPGFEENLYVSNSTFSERDLDTLGEEFAAVRKSNMYLIKSLTEEQLVLSGTANGNTVTVKALLFIMAGHIKHHLEILQQLYL
jgi:uncharacterized damage-inducible protein DinB